MRKLFVTFSLVVCAVIAKAQNLQVEGKAPDLYIKHTVAPKENFYSVGRLYNQAPKSIASYNNLTLEKGLTIGQQIKIPLNSQNLVTTSGGTDGLIPLTHVVEKSETLFRIGNEHGATPETLKAWNNLSSNSISVGSPLIVGYLKAGSAAATPSVAQDVTPAPQAAPELPAEKPKEKTQAASDNKPKETPATTDEPFTGVAQNGSNEPAATTPATATAPATTPAPATMPAAPSKPVIKDTNVAEAPKTAVPAGDLTPAVSVRSTNTGAGKSNTTDAVKSGKNADASFADLYLKTATADQQNKSGDAGTFKTTSGWQDKKYYVLINDIAPGTIVKVSGNNKFVYAKVLGNMPEMKENSGLLLRISNAAATYLGIIDPRFPVQVTYYQ